MVGIYRITSPSGKVYIGQTWDIKKRLQKYKKGCPEQRVLNYSILKYGFENHTVEMIHELPNDITQEILDNYEAYYIDSYKDSGIKMLNLKAGGRGGKHSEITKRLMSFRGRGRKQSEQHILANKLANKGRKFTETHCQRISESRKGNKFRLGIKHTEESKLKMSINHATKLNEQIVSEIKAKYSPYEYGYRRLGQEYNIAFTMVREIIKNRTWKHVQ